MGLLQGVVILWVTAWEDGPVEGMASYGGREHWFRAVFDPDLDEYPVPRRLALCTLTDEEHARQRSRHRSWEEHAGGCCCFHDGAPPPDLRSGWWHYFELHPDDRGRVVPTTGEVGEFVGPFVGRRLPGSIPVPSPDGDLAAWGARA